MDVMPATNPLSDCITAHHLDLQQWFLLHQEALLCRHADFTSQSWAIFAEGLQLHLECENRYLFISDTTLLDQTQLRWNISVYQKEHAKIIKMLAAITAMLDDYAAFTGRRQRLSLLEILEKQSSFSQVLEHHEEREEQDALHCIHAVSDASCDTFIRRIQAWNALHHNTLQQLKTYFAGHD